MRGRLTYLQARFLLLVLGVGVAAAQTALAWDRGAPPTEVLAPALFVLVVFGAIFFVLPGALVGAGLASLVYGTLLADQVAVVGLGSFTILLASRVTLYVLFGVVLALGVRYIEGRLRKLELYDQIDDDTGLFNSAFFLEDTDLERGRADRYRTLFSVVDCTIDHDAFEGVSRRRYRRTLRDLATSVESSVRRVDRASRVDDGAGDRFLLVLPQTGAEGAGVFAGRFEGAVGEFLTERGVAVDGHVRVEALTYPDAPERLEALRGEIAALEAERRAVRT